MQENLTIARPYARAAFEHARDTGRLAAWSEALAWLAAMVSDTRLRQVIHDPRVKRQRLVDLLCEIGGERFFPEFRNFVKLLLAAGRLPLAPDMRLLFEQQRAAAEGIAQVEVRSAFPLDSGEEQAIVAGVSKRLNRKVNLTTSIDKNLIAGAVVRVGDTVIDLSLRGRLQELANEFHVSR